jgi:hypothetical protein
LRTDWSTIRWTRPKLAAFTKAQAAAKSKGEEQFMFDDMVFFVTYAGYLIRFLEQKTKDGRAN